MSARIFGNADWGLESEAGMYAQDFGVDFSIDENYLPDESGCDVAAALTNPSATVSLNGFVRVGEDFSAELGASLALNNALGAAEAGAGASDEVGETLVTGIKRGAKSRDFKSLDVSAMFKPFMGGLQQAGA